MPKSKITVSAALSAPNPSSPLVIPANKTLFPLQAEAVHKMLHFLTTSPTCSCYNGSEMGTGKSVMALTALNTLTSHNLQNHQKAQQIPHFSTLIISPKVMLGTWASEIITWAIRSQNSTTIATIASAADLHNLLEQKSLPEFTIVGYDLIRKYYHFLLGAHKFTHLIADEIHYCKNPISQRARIFYTQIFPQIPYRIFLSGTPFLSSVVDGFTAFHALAPQIFPSLPAFTERYAITHETPYGPKVTGAKNIDELSALIREHFFIRFTKDEAALELPPKTFQEIILPHNFDLAQDGVRKFYYEKEASSIATSLEKGQVPVITEEFLTIRKSIGMRKVPFIAEFVTDLLLQDIPVVLFAYHQDVIAAYKYALSAYKPAVLTGATPDTLRQEQLESFQGTTSQKHKTNLIIISTAGGVGITLTRSSHLVVAELDYSPAVMNQVFARVHRISQSQNVTIYYFLVDKSLENRIVKILIDKSRTFTNILNEKE